MEHLVGQGTGTGPEELMFPLQAKCSYSSTGPSGTHQQRDALCILPDNQFYRKVDCMPRGVYGLDF